MAAIEMRHIMFAATIVIFIKIQVCTRVIVPKDWKVTAETEDYDVREKQYQNMPWESDKKKHRNKRRMGYRNPMIPQANMNNYLSNQRSAYILNQYKKDHSRYGINPVKIPTTKRTYYHLGAPLPLFKLNSQATHVGLAGSAPKSAYDTELDLDRLNQLKPKISTESITQSSTVKDASLPLGKPNNQNTKERIYLAGEASKSMNDFQQKQDILNPIKPGISTQSNIQIGKVKGTPLPLFKQNNKTTMTKERIYLAGDASKSMNDFQQKQDILNPIRPKIATQSDIQIGKVKGASLPVFKPNSQTTNNRSYSADRLPKPAYDIELGLDHLSQLKHKPQTSASTQSVPSTPSTQVKDTAVKGKQYQVITYRTKRGMGYKSSIPQVNMNNYMSNQLSAYQLNQYKKDHSRYGIHYVKKPTTKRILYPFGVPPPLGILQRYKQTTESSIKHVGGAPKSLYGIEGELERLNQLKHKLITKSVSVTQSTTAKVSCSSKPCQNGGSCITNGTDNPICACVEDYNGAFCEEPMSKCDAIGCNSINSCVSYPPEAVCLCEDKKRQFCRMDHGEPTQKERLKALVSHKGNVLVAVFSVIALLSLCTCIHCCRVCSKRGELRETYRQWLKRGTVPDDLPPDFMTISSSLCLCRAGELDKKVEVQIQAPVEREKKSKKKKKKKKRSKKSKDNESSKTTQSKSKDQEEDNQSFNCYKRKSRTYSPVKYYNSDDGNTNAQLVWDYYDYRDNSRSNTKPQYTSLPGNRALSLKTDIAYPTRLTRTINRRDWNKFKQARFHSDILRQTPSHRSRKEPRRQYDKNLKLKHFDYDKTFSEPDYKRRVPDQYESELENRSKTVHGEKLHHQGNIYSSVAKPNKIVSETHLRVNNQNQLIKRHYDPIAVMNLILPDRMSSDCQESDTDTSSEETTYEKMQK